MPTRHRAERSDVRSLDSLLAVNRRVTRGGSLPEILDDVAREAANVARGAHAISILLKVGSRWQYAGGYGLSPEYAPLIRASISGNNGVLSASAVSQRAVITITDTELDPRFVHWRAGARVEGYRSTASFPLGRGERSVGALNVYRREPGAWDPRDVQVLQAFADHAQTAIDLAQLLEEQQKQVDMLRRLVRTLEEQEHEHANRLQALSGLLTLREYDEANQFLESLETRHRRARGVVGRRVSHPVLAGLLLAESTIAYQRGIVFEIDDGNRRAELPRCLRDTEIVSIVGNLLDNAFDAVSDVPEDRRRVRLRLATTDDVTTIEVRDWGPGVPYGEEARIFDRGISSKAEHSGVGLAVVEAIVSAVGGTTTLRRRDPGTSLIVTLPLE